VRAGVGAGYLELVYRQRHQNLRESCIQAVKARRAELLYRYGSPSNPWWAGLERELPVAVEAGPPAVGYLVSTRLIPLSAAVEVLATHNRLQDCRHNGRQDSARPAFR
jgi:hypothetical protein